MRASTGCLPAFLSVALMALAGCKEADRGDGQDATPPGKGSSFIDFPAERHAEDPTVNAFIRQAIEICAAEDYEAFRLLWSGLEEPIGEQEFRRGFRATKKVSILHLLERRTRDGEIVYVVHAFVELDPNEVPEPERDIVLLLRQESGKWRIARAPRKEAKALKALLKGDVDSNALSNSNGPPTGRSGQP